MRSGAALSWDKLFKFDIKDIHSSLQVSVHDIEKSDDNDDDNSDDDDDSDSNGDDDDSQLGRATNNNNNPLHLLGNCLSFSLQLPPFL